MLHDLEAANLSGLVIEYLPGAAVIDADEFRRGASLEVGLEVRLVEKPIPLEKPMAFG